MKKALSLLLTFLIIASVFVMNIGTVSAVSSITSVNVTGVKPPVAGGHPDYSDIKLETVPPNAAEIVEMHWYSKQSFEELSENDVFNSKYMYSIYFAIRPNTGYYFEFDEEKYYNGEAEISGFTTSLVQERSNEAGSLFLDCEWVETIVYASPVAVTSVCVSGVKKPIAGTYPDYSDIKVTTVPENAAEIVDMQWVSLEDGPISDDDTFIEGEKYYIYFTIRPKAGYCFEFDGDIRYNGETAIEDYTVGLSQERFNEAGSLYLDCVLVVAEKYVPQELTDSRFFMYADEVYRIIDRGIVLSGRMLSGRVNMGDKIMVTYYDDTKAITEEMTAEAILISGKQLNYAEKGDYVGILIGMPYGINEDGTINRGKIRIGAVLQGTENTIPPVTKLIGSFKMLDTEDVEISSPIEQGYSFQAHVGTKDVTCTFLDLSGDAIKPGETRANVKLGDFYHGVVVYRGQEILIQQAGKTVGTFTVGETTAITSVKVTGVKPPVAGEHPNYSNIKVTTVPENAAEIVEAYWKMIDGPVSEDDTFSVNHIYHLYLIIKPKSCCYFEFDSNDYFNGGAAIDGFDLWFAKQSVDEPGTLCLASNYIVLCADVDMDGSVTIMDATLIQKYVAELVTLTYDQSVFADVNGDKEVNILDVTEIQKYIAQLIDSFVLKYPVG